MSLEHLLPSRHPTNPDSIMAHIRQPRSDSGRGFQEKDLETFQVVPSPLRSGDGRVEASRGDSAVPQRFRGGLVFKAHRRVYHSTLGLREIKKKKKVHPPGLPDETCLDVSGVMEFKLVFRGYGGLSHTVLIKWFEKVNSTTKSSTY